MESQIKWKRGDYIRLSKAVSRFNKTLADLDKSKKPFKLISIHDEFMCSPLNCNVMKQVYNNLLGALYCSDWFRIVINELRNDNLADKYVEPINWDIYNKIINNTYALS